MISIHQAEHLIWRGLLDKIRRSDLFIMLDHVQFVRGYYHNRNKVWGNRWVTVPVEHPTHRPINEMTTTAGWRAICGDERIRYLGIIDEVYAKAPYYQDTFDEISTELLTDDDKLFTINRNLIEWMMSCFDIDTPIILSSEIYDQVDKDKLPVGSDLILDICHRMKGIENPPVTYLSGKLGPQYMKMDEFKVAGIDVIVQDYNEPEYPHFKKEYQPGLSALDLIMCHGSKAKDYL